MGEDDPRLLYMPLSETTSRSGPCHAVQNSWWAVHPERGLIFFARGRKSIAHAAPQCNRDKNVAEMVIGKLYPWAQIVFVPLVVCPAGGEYA